MLSTCFSDCACAEQLCDLDNEHPASGDNRVLWSDPLRSPLRLPLPLDVANMYLDISEIYCRTVTLSHRALVSWFSN